MLDFNVTTDGEQLVAVYPSEGTFVAYYPFIVLRAPWVSDEEREAAEQFQRWLLPRITPELAAKLPFPRTGLPYDSRTRGSRPRRRPVAARGEARTSSAGRDRHDPGQLEM